MARLFPLDAVAVVTGASRGIGRAVALDLAREGARVVVTYSQSSGGADETVSLIEAAGGSGVARQVDVAEEQQVRRLFRDIRTEFGRIDALVCNAGITRDGFLMTMSSEKFDSVVDVNLGGTFLCCREAAKVMANQRSGSIVTMSSAPGMRGMEGQTNYSASKGAIVSFTKALAQEVAPYGVRANVVAPGLIGTGMVEAVRSDLVDKYRAIVPMRRIGTPDEVAALISFLSSDRASYITASVFVVDGGLVTFDGGDFIYRMVNRSADEYVAALEVANQQRAGAPEATAVGVGADGAHGRNVHVTAGDHTGGR
jgi:3-oxoacyl-[acyl-carrier protein] reductase